MLYWFPWKTVFVVGPIAGLLVLGLYIALRSGAANLSTHQGVERLADNFSQLVLRVVGYVLGILVLQQVVGAPFSLTW